MSADCKVFRIGIGTIDNTTDTVEPNTRGKQNDTATLQSPDYQSYTNRQTPLDTRKTRSEAAFRNL